MTKRRRHTDDRPAYQRQLTVTQNLGRAFFDALLETLEQQGFELKLHVHRIGTPDLYDFKRCQTRISVSLEESDEDEIQIVLAGSERLEDAILFEAASKVGFRVVDLILDPLIPEWTVAPSDRPRFHDMIVPVLQQLLDRNREGTP